MKKSISILIAIVIVFAGVVTYLNYFNSSSLGYVSVDINPSVQFIIDEDEEVINVIASNDDGEIILAGEAEELLGKSIEFAVEKITELAIEYGYLDPEALENNPNAVTITTAFENAKNETSIKEKLTQRVENYFKNNGIYGVVLTNIDIEEILTEAEQLGISSAKLKLIKTIQIIYPELTTEELTIKSINELIAILNKANQIKKMENLQNKITTLEQTITELTESLTNDDLSQEDIDAITDEIAELSENLANLQTLLTNYQAHAEVILELKEQKRLIALEKYNNWIENRQERANQIKERWQEFKDGLSEEQLENWRNYFSNAFQNN